MDAVRARACAVSMRWQGSFVSEFMYDVRCQMYGDSSNLIMFAVCGCSIPAVRSQVKAFLRACDSTCS